MDFWLIFFAFIAALFAIGRLLWPDPDNSLSTREHEQLDDLRQTLYLNPTPLHIGKLLFAVIFVLYFPYHKPTLGLLLAALLVVLVIFL